MRVHPAIGVGPPHDGGERRELAAAAVVRYLLQGRVPIENPRGQVDVVGEPVGTDRRTRAALNLKIGLVTTLAKTTKGFEFLVFKSG